MKHCSQILEHSKGVDPLVDKMLTSAWIHLRDYEKKRTDGYGVEFDGLMEEFRTMARRGNDSAASEIMWVDGKYFPPQTDFYLVAIPGDPTRYVEWYDAERRLWSGLNETNPLFWCVIPMTPDKPS